MRATFLAPILPRVMEEGESKKTALILMKTLILIGHYGIACVKCIPFRAIALQTNLWWLYSDFVTLPALLPQEKDMAVPVSIYSPDFSEGPIFAVPE